MAQLSLEPNLQARDAVIAKIPVPRPRPPAAGPAAVSIPTSPAPVPPAAASDHPAVAETPPQPSDCFLQLTSGLAIASALPPIAEPNGCAAPDVVRLDAVILANRRQIAIKPAATLRCTMATTIAAWIRDEVAAAVNTLDAPLAGIENFDSYECRGRNRVPGALTSEHGRANALDIRALMLGNGRRIELTDPEVSEPLREGLRASACARFTTVLGPGSDGYHENHVHVDLAERRNGYRLCQWDVRVPEIPMPRERPAEAPTGAL